MDVQPGLQRRTASRVEGRGGNGEKAGKEALSPGLRDDAQVRMVTGERARVIVPIPIVVPGVHHKGFEARKYAELPG